MAGNGIGLFWLAIGQQLQWGATSVTGGGSVLRFPISFKTWCVVWLVGDSEEGTNCFYRNKTTVDFWAGVGYPQNICWFSLGVQLRQWGAISQNGGWKTVTLPIAFKSANYIVVSSDVNIANSQACSYSTTIKSKTTTSFQTCLREAAETHWVADWIAAGGWQLRQWGWVEDGRNGITFPISFVQVLNVNIGGPLVAADGSTHLYDVSNTKFYATLEYGRYAFKGYWLAIGK